jgi:hypothetical protein
MATRRDDSPEAVARRWLTKHAVHEDFVCDANRSIWPGELPLLIRAERRRAARLVRAVIPVNTWVRHTPETAILGPKGK